jgi:hypothetical protein
MDNSQKTSPSALSATVQEIQSYPSYVKQNRSGSLPATTSAKIDDLVKSGKLTQDQANQVKTATSRNSMFGSLLDAMQNADSGSNPTSDSSASSDDPFSTLLDGLKTNDDGTPATESSLYDTLASLMPADPRVAQKAAETAKTAAAKGDSALATFDMLQSLLKNDVLLNGQATGDSNSADNSDSPIYDALVGMMPKTDPNSKI